MKKTIDAIIDSLYTNESGARARLEALLITFGEKFSGHPGYFVSTPGRTEIGGNHTDHNNGKVLAASINLDSISWIRGTDDNLVTLISAGYPTPFELSLDDLGQNKSEAGNTMSLIRGIAARLSDLGHSIGGFEACVTSDVLSGSGLSSSAAIEVLIGSIFNLLYNDNTIEPETLAKVGQYAENKYFGKPCGLMDQIACAVGGIIAIDFKDTAAPVISQVPFDFAAEDYRLLIVNTGGNHADLRDDYAAIPAEMQAVAHVLGKTVLREVDESKIYDNLDELRQKAELSAGSVRELSRAQAVLNAQQSLGNTATQEQLLLAGQLAGKAWDNANALREQAKAERERTEAANKFSTIQGKTSKTAGLDSQYQKDIADIQLYAQLYPQKIGEAEAARAAIEQQYRDQRNAAMWEEWAQQNAATQAAAAAFTAFGNNASNTLTGLITKSMDAEEAAKSLGRTVLNSLVNTFVQMGAEWVKSAIMGQTATTAAVAASTTAQAAGIATTTATSTAAAAATTAAWTPAAIMSSVASFGGAVAIGLGAMAGILALSGKRKNGGPVSAGGMYQVGEGGMPEIYQASTGKQYMIPGDNGRVISNKEMTAGGGGGVVINIQNYTSSSVDAQAGTDANGGVTVDVIVADLNNGGPISNAITSNMNVKRTPRGQG